MSQSLRCSDAGCWRKISLARLVKRRMSIAFARTRKVLCRQDYAGYPDDPTVRILCESPAYTNLRKVIGQAGQNSLAPQVGFEPTTLRLTAECSTVELLRSKSM